MSKSFTTTYVVSILCKAMCAPYEECDFSVYGLLVCSINVILFVVRPSLTETITIVNFAVIIFIFKLLIFLYLFLRLCVMTLNSVPISQIYLKTKLMNIQCYRMLCLFLYNTHNYLLNICCILCSSIFFINYYIFLYNCCCVKWVMG